MMPFNLTEHAVMRFLQRKKGKLNKDKKTKDDHFDSYLALKVEAQNSILVYVSTDRQTLYYELPHHPNLYFVVKKIGMVCVTIKPLTYAETLNLDRPTNNY